MAEVVYVAVSTVLGDDARKKLLRAIGPRPTEYFQALWAALIEMQRKIPPNSTVRMGDPSGAGALGTFTVTVEEPAEPR